MDAAGVKPPDLWKEYDMQKVLGISPLQGNMDFGDSKYTWIIIVCLDSYYKRYVLITKLEEDCWVLTQLELDSDLS